MCSHLFLLTATSFLVLTVDKVHHQLVDHRPLLIQVAAERFFQLLTDLLGGRCSQVGLLEDLCGYY